MLSLTTGILFAFVAGTYLSYSVGPKLFLALPIVFLLAFVFLPETPQYFIAKGDLEVKKEKQNTFKADISAINW